MSNVIIAPEVLIKAPIKKAVKDPFELLLTENPVCKPITETNRDEPSFDNVFVVLSVIVISSICDSGINRFIRKPTKIEANRIPAIPSETDWILILPIKIPEIIMKNNMLKGESSIVSKDIVNHQIVAYAENG